MLETESLDISGYEQVIMGRDASSGLTACIAVHSTKLGPALGGIRMRPYLSEDEAVTDVLRLSRAMTYKAAAAALPLGGGKAVIIGDPVSGKTRSLLKSMAEFIEVFEGRYLSAKDSGINLADLIEISNYTDYVTGLPHAMGGSGDPSPATAKGVLQSIRASVKYRLGQNDLRNLRVLVQGTGHVGRELCALLKDEGVRLTVSDIDEKAVSETAHRYGADIVSAEDCLQTETDVLSPCALGGILNAGTLPLLKCAMVIGGANNQLADETADNRRLKNRKILYAPDFIVNAGGIINIYVQDLLGESDPSPWLQKISSTLEGVFALSERKGITTAEAAVIVAERNLLQGIAEKE